MLEFITIPSIMGIITLGIYKILELYIRRKERLILIEKLGDRLDPDRLDKPFSLNNFFPSGAGFGALKGACLLLGLGAGLLLGYFLLQTKVTDFNSSLRQPLAQLVLGGSIFICGGLGLLIAFLIEMKYRSGR